MLYREAEATAGWPHFADQESEAQRRSAELTSGPRAGLDPEAHFLSPYPVLTLSRTWLLQNSFIYGKGANFCSLLLNAKLARSVFLKKKKPKASKPGKEAPVMNLL